MILLILSATSAVRVYPHFPSPSQHPHYALHFTKAPEPEMFSPVRGKRLPGFAAIRGFPMVADKGTPPISTWAKIVDRFFNTTDQGGYDVANCVWPGWDVVFEPTFSDFAKYMLEKSGTHFFQN